MQSAYPEDTKVCGYAGNIFACLSRSNYGHSMDAQTGWRPFEPSMRTGHRWPVIMMHEQETNSVMAHSKHGYYPMRVLVFDWAVEVRRWLCFSMESRISIPTFQSIQLIFIIKIGECIEINGNLCRIKKI